MHGLAKSSFMRWAAYQADVLPRPDHWPTGVERPQHTCNTPNQNDEKEEEK